MESSDSQFPLTDFCCILVFSLSFSCLRQEQRPSLSGGASLGQKYWQLWVCSLAAAQKAHAQRSTALEHGADIHGHCWHFFPALPLTEPTQGQTRPQARTAWGWLRAGWLRELAWPSSSSKIAPFWPISSETSCGTGALPLALLSEHFTALSVFFLLVPCREMLGSSTVWKVAVTVFSAEPP